MNRYLGKIVVIMLLLLSLGLFSGTSNIYAKNDNNSNKLVLSEKYSGQKLDRIKSSIKTKNNYRFLIKSNEGLDSIKDFFVAGEKKAKIKQLGTDTFMVRLPLNSSFLSDDLLQIDNGTLPLTIGGYDVIQPEAFELSSTGFLSGEDTAKLWGQTKVGADLFQEELSTKPKITVGLLDTGIDYTHSDLDNNYNTTLSYDFVNEDADAMDDNGHGTQVAGIVGAEVNGTGAYGVNSNSDLVALKVLDSNGIGTTYDILEAIDYAKLNNIKVINMSFGGIGDTQTSTVCQAITDAKAQGIFTVVSAGNNNSSITNLIPASCGDAITVGATDELDNKATFSNYGTGVSLYAPGTNIYTTSVNNTLTSVSGTSFSTPFVTGLLSKELAFSGGISYSGVVDNVVNGYGLISTVNIENTGATTSTGSTPIEFGSGVFVLPENMNLYSRFNDFRYLSIDNTYVYYIDIRSIDKVYRLKLNNQWIFYPSEYYTQNPKAVFTNKNLLRPFYFNSGEYIDVSDYDIPDYILQSFSGSLLTDDFITQATNTVSLGKYDVNLKFDGISGLKLSSEEGYYSFEDGDYIYYNNKNDSYKLYRINKYGSDALTGGIKVIDVANSWVTIHEGGYIYYQNSSDEYKLYKIKDDGTETVGTKIIDVPYVWVDYQTRNLASNYIYYLNSNDNYKLYRVNKDGSDVLTGGTKIIDTPYSTVTLYELGYIYYQNYNDSYKPYKIKDDGTETIGIKLVDSPYSYIDYVANNNSSNYIYYEKGNDNYKLYRANKDGSDALTGGIKVIDVANSWVTIHEGGYIYYQNSNDNYKLYKIKDDGTEIIGIKIIDVPYSYPEYATINNNQSYIYYQNSNDNYKIYKIRKDGTETIGIKIIDVPYSYIDLYEGGFIYYRNSNDEYRLYKIKDDGIEKFGIKLSYLSNNYYIFNDLEYIYYLKYNNDYSGSSFFKIKKDGTDTNLYIDGGKSYNSPEIQLTDGLQDVKIKVDSVVPVGTDYKFYLSVDNSNFTEITDKTLLNGTSNINLVNLFGIGFGNKLYFKVEIFGDQSNPTVTPVINFVEINGYESSNYISAISVVGSNGCSTNYPYAILNLYKTDSSGVQTPFYTQTKKWGSYIANCWSGGWLKGSRGVIHTCNIENVTSDGTNSYIDFMCDIYEYKTRSAAGGPGYKRHTYWGGTFTVNNDLCSYNPDFCSSPANGRLPGESYLDYIFRINQYNTNTEEYQEGLTGDPVNLNTGEFKYDNIVMQHNSKGFPFEFGLNYGNKTVYDGPVGYNFDHSYNQYLVEQSDGNIWYYNGKGGVIEFVNNGAGFNYNKVYNANINLVNGKYEIKFNNSKTYTFNSDLKLETIADNFGNTFSFTYDTEKLIQITDSNNRVYTLNYDTNKKLQNITDFNGNKVEFVYYLAGDTAGSENDLKTIKIVNGVNTKEVNFTYTLGTTDIEKHNIIKLIDSENNTYVENTYNTDDRVATQMFGSGTISYAYITDADNKVTQNSVIDRELNNVIYTYDANGNTLTKTVKKLSGDSVYRFEYNSDNYVTKEILPLGNGFTYAYDSNHNLTEKRQKADVNAPDSSNDIVTSYTYDLDFNKPTQVISPNGAITNFTLDVSGNVTKKETLGVTDLDGVSQTVVENYTYNSLGELTKRIDANGNETSFEYSSGNLVKSIKGIAPNTIETIYNYDTKGNITSITDGELHTTNLTYDDFNLLNSLTTPEGITSEFTYNKLNKKVNESVILGDLSKVSTNYTYDILDNPTHITSDIDATRQKTIVTKYDKNSNITEIKDANNATIQFTYNEDNYITEKKIINGTQNIITKYEYDTNNRLTKQINPNNSEIIFTYDLYDRIIKQTLSNGLNTRLAYDKAGNILETSTYSSTQTLLQKETNTYDLLNRTTSNTKYQLDNNTQITNKTYYDSVGNIIKIIDAKAGTINYNYDSFNRLKQITDSLGNIIKNTYNKNDKLTGRQIIGTDGKTVTTSYTYDNDNRLKTETNNLNQTISYAYNNLNQLTSKTEKDGLITTYKYDYVGNLTQETTGSGTESKTTKYEYDINGNKTKVTDAKNNVTTYEYDKLNRVIKQTYPDTTFITYEYDVSGNLIKRTDPNGTVVNNSYDDLNRLTSRTIQTSTGVLGATLETYTYDELGRLTNGTDNQNNALNFTYDSLNRLVSENGVNYTYDNNGNITSINNTNYTYDIANRLKTVKNGTQNIATYTHDSLTKTNLTLGNGVTTNYTYDELLRLASLGTYNYTYNTSGNITNDGKDSYTYDTLYRLTSVNYDKVNTPGYNGDKIERFYYDAVGNRTTQENYSLKDITTETCTEETIVEDITLPNGKTKTVERKVTNCETATTQVEKQKNSIDYITNSLNQYTTLQTKNKNGEIKKEFTYEYDKNGNLKKDDINQYFYDYKNRLIKVIQNEIIKVDENGSIIETIPEKEIVNYTYDILGRRIEKKTEDRKIDYTYAGQNAIEENIYTLSGTLATLEETRKNIYSNEMDDILTTIITDHIHNTTQQIYYEKNHLGSITKITDETGAVIEQYEYDAFGTAYASVNNVEAVTEAQSNKTLNIKKSEGSEASEGNNDEIIIDNIRYKRYNGVGKVGNTRLYTGREYDAELKLYYFRARYYSPDTGRFINRDPIDIADDVNLYAYVGNNGVMYVDRSGLQKDIVAESEILTSSEEIIEEVVINQRTLDRIGTLHPLIRERTENFIKRLITELDINVYITSSLRTFEEQNTLYSQGRNGNPGSIVTNARGGQSYHNYGLAFDIAELTDEGTLNYDLDWNSIGTIGEDEGFEWGGSWNTFVDRPHFQESFGYTTNELLEFVNNGEVDSNGYIQGYSLFQIE